MSKARPIDIRIAEIEERQRQLEEQKKQLMAKAKEQDRKERTRRLIQIGAIMDSLGITEVQHADSLKTSLLEDEALWKKFILAAGAKWPPEDMMAMVLE